MTVSEGLDNRFREAAAAAGLIDAAFDLADTPIGTLLVATTDRGLCQISFDPDRGLDELSEAAGRRVLRVPRRIEDFHALSVMSAILGGLFNSRLNRKLREEKGYSYGASAGFDLRRAAVDHDRVAGRRLHHIDLLGPGWLGQGLLGLGDLRLADPLGGHGITDGLRPAAAVNRVDSRERRLEVDPRIGRG